MPRGVTSDKYGLSPAYIPSWKCLRINADACLRDSFFTVSQVYGFGFVVRCPNNRASCFLLSFGVNGEQLSIQSIHLGNGTSARVVIFRHCAAPRLIAIVYLLLSHLSIGHLASECFQTTTLSHYLAVAYALHYLASWCDIVFNLEPCKFVLQFHNMSLSIVDVKF